MRRRSLSSLLLALLLLAVGAAPASADWRGDPILEIAHHRPGGGINLWEFDLAGAQDGTMSPHGLVQQLDTGGFRYDQARFAAGEFGANRPGEPEIPDVLVAHRQPDGSLLLWVTGNGRPPQLWADLRGGGWSWEASRQYVADVDSDGLDDVVTVHRNAIGPGAVGVNVWVHRSTGTSFADPVLWRAIAPGTVPGTSRAEEPFVDTRYLVGHLDSDSRADLVTVHRGATRTSAVVYAAWLNTGSSFADPRGTASGCACQGWSFDQSRDVLLDEWGFGTQSLVNIHAQPGGGMLVFQRYFSAPEGAFSGWILAEDLRGGGWSWAGSRQLVADVDDDGSQDLVTLHEQATGGELVWLHRYDRLHPSTFTDPLVIGDLRSGGFDFRASRESMGFWDRQ